MGFALRYLKEHNFIANQSRLLAAAYTILSWCSHTTEIIGYSIKKIKSSYNNVTCLRIIQGMLIYVWYVVVSDISRFRISKHHKAPY